jgi:hypothetical protein
LEELKDKAREVKDKWGDSYSLIRLVEVNQKAYQQAERVLRTAEETFKEEMGDTCPLCNSPVKESWL